MMPETNQFVTRDQQTITWYRWLSSKEGARPVLIVHGMAEHALRYENFAHFLNEEGYHVYAMDLRGHGQSIQAGKTGHFADNKGWFAVVEDLALFTDQIYRIHQKPPLLIGHSMGSLLLRSFCIEGKNLHASKVVLIGSSMGLPPVLMKVASSLAKTLRTFKKPWAPSPFMDRLVFGPYKKSIANHRTPFDWLSRDPSIVDAYIEDPLCGFVCSSQFYVDLIEGLLHCNQPNRMLRMKNKQDLLFLSGSEDPVGNKGKDIPKLGHFFRDNEPYRSSSIVYPDFRHELLNEQEKERVYEDILTFLKSE